ncbi:multidrug effflux MFS transporter [Streptacidiphilus fuscans]|uniref:Multidrug effflux MFS transporter n=1 Tax=Streptacidiphilus fuscans TaxID=2789292 RepID=A0A931B1I6_9ACTN|nr:multidrug effflux MFS transporter [Streptacidiphilus fuscans]MBF9068533.1 multidrug effflux MFS transporter [Streptacidiphilus fuscans]
MDATQAPAPTSRAAGLRLLLILGALSAFGPLSLDMYLPGLPQLAADFRVSDSAVQLTLTSCLIGLALGQLIAGPIADSWGRRRPLLIGLAAYAAASVLCALAPSVAMLTALRIVQGLAGGVGIVISRAVVRDLHEGTAAARFFSTLMLVNGTAPILAPLLGGQLLRFTDWRGIFVTLSVIGCVLLAAAAFGLRETLPPERRRRGGLGETLHGMRGLLRDRAFVGYALSGGFSLAAMFAYISGSSFVLQNIYGLDAQTFSLVFGGNALGIVALGQLNGVLLRRFPVEALLRAGLVLSGAGGIGLLVSVLAGLGLPGVLVSLFALVSSVGLISPNGTARAMDGHAGQIGAASALVGLLQYGVGGFAAPLVGLGGSGTALPMAIVACTFALAAVAVYAALVGRDRAAAPVRVVADHPAEDTLTR